jgi:hypothetical protein
LAKFLISMANFANGIYLVAVMGIWNREAGASAGIPGAAGRLTKL